MNSPPLCMCASPATSPRERYLTDEEGNRVAVVLDIEAYEALLDQLDEIEAIRAYDEAKSSDDERLSFEAAVEEIDRRRS